jgi:hypothetical protein
MTLAKSGLLIMAAVLVAGFLMPCLAQSAGGDVYTISVASPTAAKDVQTRYLLTDAAGSHRFLSSAEVDGSSIVIKTTTEGLVAKSFKAILLAPGCQLATISVDDLSVDNKQSQFQCQNLPTLAFQGQIDASGLGQNLQVNVLYQCSWAGKFFGIGSGAFSPVSIATVPLAADGTFSVDLLDFASDPLYASLSNEATLQFMLVEPNGQRRALTPPSSLGSGNSLHVAINYPAVVFKLKQ